MASALTIILVKPVMSCVLSFFLDDDDEFMILFKCVEERSEMRRFFGIIDDQ